MPESSYLRGDAPEEGILASQPVSGSDWLSAGRLQNHIVGRGRVLCPEFRPIIGTVPKGAYTFALLIVPTYAALVRRWRLSADSLGELEFDVNGTSVTYPGSSVDDGGLPRGIVIEEVLGSQTAAESEATVTITSSSSGSADLTIDSLSCHEYPRAVIDEGGAEAGVSLSAFRDGQPVRADAFAGLYTGAMNPDYGRRVLFQWAVPYEVGGAISTTYAAATTSSTFSDVFDVSKPCHSRKKYNDGNSYTVCNARVFAWVSAGGSGEVRITSASGSSSVSVIGDSTPKWTDPITDVRILHEDLSASDGLPGGGWDEVQVEFRATTGTLYVASAIVYE